MASKTQQKEVHVIEVRADITDWDIRCAVKSALEGCDRNLENYLSSKIMSELMRLLADKYSKASLTRIIEAPKLPPKSIRNDPEEY